MQGEQQKKTMLEIGQIIKNRFKVVGLIGQGTFSEVYKCKDRKPQQFPEQEEQNLTVVGNSGRIPKQYIALKVYNRSIAQIDSSQYDSIKREVDIMRKLNHPNIVRLIERYEEKSLLMIAMELCEEETLQKKLFKEGNTVNQTEYQQYKCFDEQKTLYFFKQLVSAFYYLQKDSGNMPIVHRDVKLENIFISKNKQNPENSIIKLGDFGFAQYIYRGKDEMLQTYCGSALTVAPEVLKFEPYNSKCDIFSLGCVVYHLLFGIYPFQSTQREQSANDLAEYQKRVLKQEIDFQRFGVTISLEMEKLLRNMLNQDPNNRISFDALFQHEFFQSVWNIPKQSFIIKQLYPVIENSSMNEKNIRKLSAQFTETSKNNDWVNIKIFCVLKELQDEVVAHTQQIKKELNNAKLVRHECIYSKDASNVQRQLLRETHGCIIFLNSQDQNSINAYYNWRKLIEEETGISEIILAIVFYSDQPSNLLDANQHQQLQKIKNECHLKQDLFWFYNPDQDKQKWYELLKDFMDRTFRYCDGKYEMTVSIKLQRPNKSDQNLSFIYQKKRGSCC